MKEVVSAGGIVNYNNTILLLKKFNGDWVLPKGRVEEGESLADAALREVFEETGVRGEIKTYLGKIEYEFKSNWDCEATVKKVVHWFLMVSKDMSCVPQRKEGFIEARFVHMDRIGEVIRYEDEKEIVSRAIERLQTSGI